MSGHQVLPIEQVSLETNIFNLQAHWLVLVMDRHTTMTIYVVPTLLLLLGHTAVILSACPLPVNNTTTTDSCHQCNVLRYVQVEQPSHININVTMALNLRQSENSAGQFAQKISSNQNRDYLFDSISLPGPVRGCYGSEQNAKTGSPCTNFIRMDGTRLPNCMWNYTCNYSPNRFPQYIWEAQCAQAPHGYRSQEVYYRIPTLVYSSEGSNCLPFKSPEATYTWRMQRVVVACVCVPQPVPNQ